jgi:hypothetical protein
MLKRFGEKVRDAHANYRRYLQEGLKSGQEEDELVDLVRKSNSGRETGRKVGCWVIGDRKFVAHAIASAEANRLRVSRFEREGGTLENIAVGICSKFSVTWNTGTVAKYLFKLKPAPAFRQTHASRSLAGRKNRTTLFSS